MKLTKWSFVISLFLISKSFSAISPKVLNCSTPNGERIIHVQDHAVAIKTDSFNNNDRYLAAAIEVRTKHSHLGFTKYWERDGKKHKLHVENLKSLNEVEDYISITSPQGHEMTYPLNCQVN